MESGRSDRSALVWPAVMVVILFALFGAAVRGYGDTYNFFFGKKDKKHQVEAAEKDANQEDGDSDESRSDSNDAPAAASEKTDSAKAPQAPIIINNINNNDNTNRNVFTPTAHAVQRPEEAAKNHAEQEEDEFVGRASLEKPPAHRPQWNFTFSGVGGVERFDSLRLTGGGPMVTLGLSAMRFLDWNFYAGGIYSINDVALPFAGLDLELTPFRIRFAETWDLFRLGFFAGGSTLAAVPENMGSLHGGVRASIHLGPAFGITASLRANLGYIMAEGGITASL